MILTWLSHGSWLIEHDGRRTLLDPFLTDNPAAKTKPEELSGIDTVLVSHGHFDHVADVASIARANEANVVAIFEIASWFQTNRGIEKTVGMNIGGWTGIAGGRVKMVPAVHSSTLPDGSPAGVPAGFVLESEGKRVYFACDTALFSDMRLIGAMGLDAAIIPIGDLFTMGIEDSIEAIRLLTPKHVLPAHYNTWPPIEQNVQDWASQVRTETSAEPHTPAVGDAVEID